MRDAELGEPPFLRGTETVQSTSLTEKALSQVTQTYSPVTARSDHSLLQYGFVEEFEEPLLAAVDSATGFDMEDDTWYGKPHLLLMSLQLPRACNYPKQVPSKVPASLLLPARLAEVLSRPILGQCTHRMASSVRSVHRG